MAGRLLVRGRRIGRRTALAVLTVTAVPAGAVEFENGFRLGGAVRFNYVHKDWDSRYSRKGQIDFDTARVDIGYDRGNWLGSAQYRYYRFRGGHETHFLHHAWLGYRAGDAAEVHAGVNPIPFGILPYASNNFYFSLAYYVGLEDSYNLGLKLLRRAGPLNLQLGYYPRDGGNWGGKSEDSARYTVNIVEEGAFRNRERDTLIGRATYTYAHGDLGSSEFGLSLLTGRLPNASTGRDGDRHAGALHYKGEYGPWGIMLQAARYRIRAESPPAQDRKIVVMGAYDFPYEVAAKGTVYIANLSYRLGGLGPLRDVVIYTNYSRLAKDESGFRDSEQQAFGVSFVPAPKFFVYVDYLLGRQHPYIGPNFTTGLAAGGADDSWHQRINVHVGYYF
ncbi:MAG: hypothetical protein ACT4P8_18785 [Betaproteobacteria bacterium]